jgi:GntR family transcriptional regulator of arabinose operon
MPSHLLRAASKTEQVADYVRNLIASGRFGPGDCLVGERQLAQQLGISLVTVRRGLKQLANEGVIERIQGKGTFVKEVDAVAAPTPVNPPISLAYPAIATGVHGDVFLGPVIDGIQDELMQAGLVLHLHGMNGQALMDALFDPLKAKNNFPGGVIVVNHRITPEDAVLLGKAGVAYVQIGAPTAEAIPFVDVDHFRGGFLAGLHLVQRGCRRPALLLGKLSEQPYCQDICRGFSSAFEAHGIILSKDMMLEKTVFPSRSELVGLCRNLLAKHPDGMLVMGDTAPLTVLNVCRDAGLVVPDDLALISYNDSPLLEFQAQPPITAVSQPLVELGRSAARLLLQLRQDEKVSSASLLQPELKVRDSSMHQGVRG